MDKRRWKTSKDGGNWAKDVETQLKMEWNIMLMQNWIYKLVALKRAGLTQSARVRPTVWPVQHIVASLAQWEHHWSTSLSFSVLSSLCTPGTRRGHWTAIIAKPWCAVSSFDISSCVSTSFAIFRPSAAVFRFLSPSFVVFRRLLGNWTDRELPFTALFAEKHQLELLQRVTVLSRFGHNFFIKIKR